MSDTPRTDEFWRTYRVPYTHGSKAFARQLERELTEAKKQRDTLMAAMIEMWPFIEEDDSPACNTAAFNAAIQKYKAALAAVKGGQHE
jgi:hypothetical protein